jgi:hypothetical protein
MPHATCEFGFEWEVFRWCGGFSNRMTGKDYKAFFIALDESGSVTQLVFSDTKSFGFERKETVRSDCTAWIFYDPFDAPEYCAIEWGNVHRETMERLMAKQFSEDDFISEKTKARMEYPASWFVMF